MTIPIILTISYLILFWISGIIDPGIMKRNFDCYEAHQLNIKIIHKGAFKTTKICPTCYIVRPFRATHCKECDNCIMRFDHHCPWLGSCLGKRNYIFFYFYLLLLNLNNFFIVIIAISCIATNFSANNQKKIIISLNCLPSIFTLFFVICIMLFTTRLLFHHTYCILYNITTKEQKKKTINYKIGNPYDRGYLYNCIDFLCRRKREPTLNIHMQLRKEKIESISNKNIYQDKIVHNNYNKNYDKKYFIKENENINDYNRLLIDM